MKQVEMSFRLAGKSMKGKKNLLDVSSTQDVYDSVKDQVVFSFGDRAVVFANEAEPAEFYSAGWFISKEAKPAELVVVAYGSSMAIASALMMSYVSNVDWTKYAVNV